MFRPSAVIVRMVVFFVPLGICASDAIAPERLPQVMEQLEADREAGRFDQAEQLARAVVRDHPGFAEAYGALARVLEAQGRREEAATVLLEVGQGLTHVDLAESGLPYLREALRLAPDASATHAALGHALLVNRIYDQAVTHLRRAMELGEEGLAVRIYLGSALWETGQWQAAEVTLRDALRVSDRSLPALHTLGGFLVFRGEYSEAVELLSEAVERAPESLPIALDLARALEGAGEQDGAVATYRRLLQLDPTLTEPRYALARLLRQRGEIDAARKEMDTFQRFHDEQQDRKHRSMLRQAQLDAGWELIRQGRMAAAARHFGQLETSAESLHGLATAQARAGDHAAAVRSLERAVALSPDRVDLKIRLAEERLATRR